MGRGRARYPGRARASHRLIRAVGKGELLVVWTEATRDGPVHQSFKRIEPQLYRFPAISPAAFRRALASAVGPEPATS